VLKVLILLVVFNLFVCNGVYALSPEGRLKNDQSEDLAHKIFTQVRCLICSGQVIESSDNQFALSMRQLIRKKITEGLDEDQIKKFLVQKYGEDILLDTNYDSKNIILWFLPIIFAITIIFVFIRFFR